MEMCILSIELHDLEGSVNMLSFFCIFITIKCLSKSVIQCIIWGFADMYLINSKGQLCTKKYYYILEINVILKVTHMLQLITINFYLTLNILDFMLTNCSHALAQNILFSHGPCIYDRRPTCLTYLLGFQF